MGLLHVGCCITAHGFGHAARALAVMEALSKLAEIKLTIISQVPEWFIRSSYSGPYSLFPLQTDVGLVQQGPLEQDIQATVSALSDFYPLQDATLLSLSTAIEECSMLVCDISPAGILAARTAGVPSVLIENFTWDWIYEGYRDQFQKLEPFITYLSDVNAMADYRIQTMPVCEPVECDLTVEPVARAFRKDRDQVRRTLRVEEDVRMVLISMGGIGMKNPPLEKMRECMGTTFVLSGYTGENVFSPNIIYVDEDNELFHPDLVAASDAVIGKVGYSTLAEVYHAGVPFGFVSRHDFRESAPLASFIKKEMSGLEIDQQSFRQGRWIDLLPQLFRLSPTGGNRRNGAVRCADFLFSLSKMLNK